MLSATRVEIAYHEKSRSLHPWVSAKCRDDSGMPVIDELTVLTPPKGRILGENGIDSADEFGESRLDGICHLRFSADEIDPFVFPEFHTLRSSGSSGAK